MVNFGVLILFGILFFRPRNDEESTLLNLRAASGPMSREKNEFEILPGENTLEETELLGMLVGLLGLFTKLVSDGLELMILFSTIFSGISDPDGDRFIDEKSSFNKN